MGFSDFFKNHFSTSSPFISQALLLGTSEERSTIVNRKKENTMSEETLDPEDWESMRNLGHKMVNDMVNYLKTVRERPVWQNVPDQVKSQFTGPVPIGPERPEEVLREFVEKVLPYPMEKITRASGAGYWELEPSWAPTLNS